MALFISRVYAVGYQFLCEKRSNYWCFVFILYSFIIIFFVCCVNFFRHLCIDRSRRAVSAGDQNKIPRKFTFCSSLIFCTFSIDQFVYFELIHRMKQKSICAWHICTDIYHLCMCEKFKWS